MVFKAMTFGSKVDLVPLPARPYILIDRPASLLWLNPPGPSLRCCSPQSAVFTAQIADRILYNVYLLASQSPMVRILPLLGKWKVIYSDDHSVFVARAGAA